jgi:hypothetical protein
MEGRHPDNAQTFGASLSTCAEVVGLFHPTVRGFSPLCRCCLASVSGSLAENMEDLPAVEPVKIYENTYRLEPADTEK